MENRQEETRFSVIIVTCNRLELLKECVAHASNQKKMPEKIIIINNASTDGTFEYLQEEQFQDPLYHIVNEAENLGGAGGFARGVETALTEKGDWFLLIDDDAMIAPDFLSEIGTAIEKYPECGAFTGVVETEGQLDPLHRRRRKKAGSVQMVNISEEEYKGESFELDAASFCGLVVGRKIVEKIGLPNREFFIWNDDLEYSLRIRMHSAIKNINSARLNHKTNLYSQRNSKKYLWKDYYGFRNYFYTCRKYGSKMDCVMSYAIPRLRLIYWRIQHIISRKDYVYNLEMLSRSWKDAKHEKLGIVKEYFPG